MQVMLIQACNTLTTSTWNDLIHRSKSRKQAFRNIFKEAHQKNGWIRHGFLPFLFLLSFTLNSSKVWWTSKIPGLNVSKLELRNNKGHFLATWRELGKKIIFWTANLTFHRDRRHGRFLHNIGFIFGCGFRFLLWRGYCLTEAEAQKQVLNKQPEMVFCVATESETKGGFYPVG